MSWLSLQCLSCLQPRYGCGSVCVLVKEYPAAERGEPGHQHGTSCFETAALSKSQVEHQSSSNCSDFDHHPLHFALPLRFDSPMLFEQPGARKAF